MTVPQGAGWTSVLTALDEAVAIHQTADKCTLTTLGVDICGYR
jgi:hypothetical protein